MAPNIEAILDWCKERRFDVLTYIEQIVADNHRGSKNESLLFLLTIGFAAGRAYQMKYPELKTDYEYHRGINDNH